jgi:hypothetical protein
MSHAVESEVGTTVKGRGEAELLLIVKYPKVGQIRSYVRRTPQVQPVLD